LVASGNLSFYVVSVHTMKKADEHLQFAHGMQSNTPADDCQLDKVFENPLADREYTPPIEMVSSSCDPLAADIEDASASRNVRRCLLSGTSELHLRPDNTIQNRVVADRNCVPISTVFERRPIEERDAPTERNVRMRFATSQPGVPVNGSSLLASSGEPFSATGITRPHDISDRTVVSISRIFDRFRNMGADNCRSPQVTTFRPTNNYEL
ncbi:hypothetical protein Tco_1086094, partial [Tanacetum coccineum]